MNKNLRYLISSLICLASIISCSQKNLISSSYISAYEMLLENFSPNQFEISSELIKNIPYASSVISFDNNRQSLLILEESDNKRNIWTSNDEIKFIERNGRIIGTVGLPNDLYNIYRPDIDFEKIIAKKSISYNAFYSFRKPDFNNLKVEIKAKVEGLEKVSIMNAERNLLLVEEKLHSKKINWTATNRYWIDPVTHVVWRSVQNLSPKLPALSLTITKQPKV